MTPAQIKYIIIAIVSLFLLGAGAYGVYAYLAAIKEAEAAKVALADMTQERDSLNSLLTKQKEMTNAANALARARGIRLAEAERKGQEADDKFRRMQAMSTPDRTWAATPVPDATRQLRRANAGCSPDLTLPCSGGEHAGDGGTPDDGRDQRRPETGSGSPPVSPPSS